MKYQNKNTVHLSAFPIFFYFACLKQFFFCLTLFFINVMYIGLVPQQYNYIEDALRNFGVMLCSFLFK